MTKRLSPTTSAVLRWHEFPTCPLVWLDCVLLDYWALYIKRGTLRLTFGIFKRQISQTVCWLLFSGAAKTGISPFSSCMTWFVITLITVTITPCLPGLLEGELWPLFYLWSLVWASGYESFNCIRRVVCSQRAIEFWGFSMWHSQHPSQPTLMDWKLPLHPLLQNNPPSQRPKNKSLYFRNRKHEDPTNAKHP